MNRTRRGDAKIVIIVVLVVVVVMACACSGILVALLLPAVQQARTAARVAQSTNHMKQIALALHNYHDEYGSFPPAYTVDENGQPLHSWRVLILPYLEQGMLYERLNLEEPWDSPANQAVAETMPAIYSSPFLESDAGDHTPYVAIAGPNTVISTESSKAFRDITVGASNAVMVVEDLANPVVWTQPDDLSPAEFLKRNLDDTPGRATLVGTADGAVMRYTDDEKQQLQGMLSIDGM